MNSFLIISLYAFVSACASYYVSEQLIAWHLLFLTAIIGHAASRLPVTGRPAAIYYLDFTAINRLRASYQLIQRNKFAEMIIVCKYQREFQ